MKTRIWLLVLVAAVLWSGGAAWADGDFYVVAGGGPAVGTKITSVPYVIDKPGFYFLAGNLTKTGPGDAITVNADSVTIDLMGFSLIGVSLLMLKPDGIHMSDRSNVEVRNGTVTGFSNGIWEDNPGFSKNIFSLGHRVINIRAHNNSTGISLIGNNHMVKGCSVFNNSSNGIYCLVTSGVIDGCLAYNNGVNGILLRHGIISNCFTRENKGDGINLNDHGVIVGNSSVGNSGKGINFGGAYSLIDRNQAISNDGGNYFSGDASTVWGRNVGNPPHLDYPAPY